MKTITLTLFAAALGIAQSQPSTSTTPAAKAAVTPAAKVAAKTTSNVPDKKPQLQSLPAGAVQVEPYLYRYTDSSGKNWMYRQTPFGMSRWEEGSIQAPQPSADKGEPVVVTDLGDSVRFQRKTPFGFGTWVRKKTELTDEEKALLAGSSQPSSTVSKSTELQVADKTKEEK